MEKVEKTEFGNIRVYKTTIATMVEKAICDIDGFKMLSNNIVKSLLKKFLGDDSPQGIKVEVLTNNELKIDIDCVLQYGYNIADVALTIQDKVKNTIESYSGIFVSEVNINVRNVAAYGSQIKEAQNVETDF